MNTSEPMINKQIPYDDIEEPDLKTKLRQKVNLILPDGLMIVLALIMVPIVVVPLLVDLSPSVASFFVFTDYTIIGIFAIEYILKTALAENILKHVINPWHILDLIIVLLPLIGFLEVFGAGIGRSSPLLRLLRIARVVAAGGRAVDRTVEQRAAKLEMIHVQPSPMEIGIINDNLQNVQTGVTLKEAVKYFNNRSHNWINFLSVSEPNFDELSRFLGIPRLILESELIEESYPRIDYFEHCSMIFARLADVEVSDEGARRLFVNRVGLLVICIGHNIVTISRGRSELFLQMLEKAKTYHTKDEPVVVSILYAILKHALEKDSRLISAVEQELMKLETATSKDRPPNFLEITFHLKKEVNQLVPSLLHMKEITSQIASKRVPIKGFEDRHERLFDILSDEASYLYETAINARDNLLSLIDLYINTTSFELNKVMRVIAVITCLGIIPALAALFGSNFVSQPWNIELWQLFAALIMAMIGMGWVFYRLGWLKG